MHRQVSNPSCAGYLRILHYPRCLCRSAYWLISRQALKYDGPSLDTSRDAAQEGQRALTRLPDHFSK
jgi:hypothetical protein